VHVKTKKVGVKGAESSAASTKDEVNCGWLSLALSSSSALTPLFGLQERQSACKKSAPIVPKGSFSEQLK